MSAKSSDEKSSSPQVDALIQLLVAQQLDTSPNALEIISRVVDPPPIEEKQQSLLGGFVSSLMQLVQPQTPSDTLPSPLDEFVSSLYDLIQADLNNNASEQQQQPNSALFDRAMAHCARLRAALHPSASDAPYQLALQAYHASASKASLHESVALLKALEGTPQARRHDALFSKLSGALSRVARRLHGGSSGGSANRFLRARQAAAVFSQHAGLNMIPGAAVDQFGNSVGADADLGVDGAFEGLKVVVVHGYTSEGFDFSLPDKVLKQKGFLVQRFVAATLPDAEAFAEALADASQLWVISHSTPIVRPAHLDAIKAAWQQGMGLYLMGDNEPWYADANAVIRHLFGPSAEMRGNLPGDKIAPLVDLDDPKDSLTAGSHFVSHLLTTGISKLYTGITVAFFRPEAAEFGFQPVLWESRGSPIVLYRDSRDGEGPVICDGAFTKLFVKFDHCGSDRFVRNCACWLSAITPSSTRMQQATKQQQKEAEEEEKRKQKDVPAIDFTGALEGECDITFEKGPLALLVTQLADPYQNTTDYVIDNALGFARQNLVFGQQAYGYETAKMFLSQGQDPFRRVPVVAVVPLLDIRVASNRALVEELLSHIFFGGRRMPKVVWSIFLSVCEHMASSHPDHPEVWEFYTRQILAEVTSTPTFTDVGPQVPLLQAMAAFFHPAAAAAFDPAPYRKILSHSGVKLRLLVRRGQMKPSAACKIFRRLLLKALLAACLGFAKAHNAGANQPLMPEKLLGLCFELYHGIWLSGTERLVSFDDALAAFAASPEQVRPVLLEAELMAAALQRPVVLTPNETTLLLLVLHALPGWSISVEALLAHVVASPIGSAVWHSKPDSPLAMDALRQLYAPLPPIDPSHAYAGFATGHGPSVWQCCCGVWFGDPSSDVSHEALKEARNLHFQQVYASDSRGYPTATSQHFSGNRSVIQVLVSDRFKSLTSRQEANGEVEKLVAQAINRGNRGNFHRADIRATLETMIDDFLAGRARGWSEPASPSSRIDFGVRADLEKPDAIKRYSSSPSSSS